MLALLRRTVGGLLAFIYFYLLIYLFILFNFCFLLPNPQVVEIPRLGIKLELQLWPIPWPQQFRIRAASATYTTAHSTTGSSMHWAGPGIEPSSSQILVRSVIAEPQRTLHFFFLVSFFLKHKDDWQWRYPPKSFSLLFGLLIENSFSSLSEILPSNKHKKNLFIFFSKCKVWEIHSLFFLKAHDVSPGHGTDCVLL